jgi:hypothetical protein
MSASVPANQTQRLARRREFRPARVVVVLAGLCLLSACEGEELIPASKFVPPDSPEACPGAYSPSSDVCWKEPENDGGDEPIQTNAALAMENQARFAGMNRCLAGIIGAPGVEGRVTLSFGTQRLGGKYAPKNCGAVWIEDSFGFYVRTVNVWAAERRMSVVAWFQSVCQTDPTIPDAVTSATLPKPAAHTVTWDTKDWRGNVVPDGVYTVWMQVTENEIFPEGPFMTIDFTKGPAPVTVPIMKPVRGFENVQLVYTPGGAAAPTTTTP